MAWWLDPIDPSRAHDVGLAVSWHARSMVLAWGVLAPLAVLAARYFKVLPGQDWPRVLDAPLWWRCHWMGQAAVLVLTVAGLGLVIGRVEGLTLHRALGYGVAVLLAVQVGSGLLRGTKGGPRGDGGLRGDHYDMTLRRVVFEWVHKTAGLAVLVLAAGVIGLGLWEVNAPRWMWLGLGMWYLALGGVAAVLQSRGWARDTYQAIWGPDPAHPGNHRAPIGWGVRRIEDRQPGD